MALAIDPSTPTTIYAGIFGAVFKSTNGGTSWTAVTTTGVVRLAIDFSNTATVYVGTGGSGVFKSTDGGTTWQPTGASTGNGALPATTISMVSGNNQTGTAGQPLRYPLVAVVTNASAIPVAGVMVNFAVTAGGGTLSNTQLTTDSQGVAFTTLTLGPTVGTNTVTATADGLTGSPLIFTTATYLVGDAFPAGSDAVTGFGDGILNNLDLIFALRAVTKVPGFTPANCSDRFDAIDSYPPDTDSTRGGDGALNNLDLIETLRRVTNIDTTRPVRASRGLTCP